MLKVLKYKKRKISITDKLIIYYVSVSFLAVVIMGWVAYDTTKTSLFERTFSQLTAIREVKAREMETFFRSKINETKSLAESVNLADSNFRIIENFIANSEKYSGYLITDNPAMLFGDRFQSGVKNQIIDYSILNKKPGNYEISIISMIEKGAYLVMKIDESPINKTMLELNPESGFGMSGESYIVGRDGLMRSQSRFVDNSVMKIVVKTPAADSAVAGKSGITIIDDYRGISVLSSYSPLNIPGLDWAILAEMDYSEAMKPIRSIETRILLITSIISILTFIITYLISKKITNPINRITSVINAIGSGKFSERSRIGANDEIGELADSINVMASKLQDQEIELEKEKKKRFSIATDAQDLERERLAKDLHDGLGQSIFAIKLMLERIEPRRLNGNGNLFNDVKEGIDNSIEEIRRISNGLMPAVLKEFGLPDAIRGLCKTISENTDIKAEFNDYLTKQITDKRTRIYLFRIAQEALSNIAKHSGASLAYVEISSGGYLSLEIRDNGNGFDTELARKGDGNGLYNMKERAEAIGGKLTIRSGEGIGTHISFYREGA